MIAYPDRQHFLLPGHAVYEDHRGEVRAIKCCTDNEDSNCDWEEPPPPPPPPSSNPLVWPLIVRIGEHLRAQDSPSWTAVIACHETQRNRWIDEVMDPDARISCDARYGAFLAVTFNIGGGRTSNAQISAPGGTNPCTGTTLVYEVDTDPDMTFSTVLEIHRVGCE